MNCIPLYVIGLILMAIFLPLAGIALCKVIKDLINGGKR